MIKLTKIAALSSSLVVFSGLTAHAFLLPPGPVTPTVDAPTDVTFSLENVGATAQMYAAQAQTYANNMTKAAKSAKKKYMDKFTGFMGGLFKKKEKQAIPGSKTIQESKIADIYDAESVKKALYTLFLAYPVDCEKDADSFAACVAYKEKAEEFYQDTVIEIYTSVRLLEQEMPNLAVQVESLSATFSGGGGAGAESGDDENGARKNAFNAYETMDSILKITQEVTAMKAQYEAALMLREQVKPAPYVSKKERKAKEKAAKEAAKTSSLWRDEPIKTASLGVVSTSETLAFGQLGMITQADFKLKTENEAAAADVEEEDDDEEYVYDPSLYGTVSFEDASEPLIASPFAGNEEKVLELDKIAPLYEKAQDALDVHNLLQALDSYRGIFENYEQYKQLHQKALDAVAAADQCSIQYLKRYYPDPEQVWKGSIADAAINDYDARRGISGWAVKAFEVAKSEESLPIDTDELGTIDINSDIDTDDVNSMETIKADLEKQDMASLANPEQTAAAEKATRESQMISFNIGAEAAQLLAQDQYEASPQWGMPSTKFPVWNDQINFYTQYLDGKYENVKDYLHQLDVSSVIVDIAYPLNDLLVDDEEERANNRAGLDKLAGMLKSEEQSSDPASVMKDLESSRDKLLQQAQQSKAAKMQPLESRRKTLETQMERASTLLSDYSEQLNSARQNKLTADTGVEVKESLIVDLEERRGDDEDNMLRKTDIDYNEETYEVSPEKTEKVYSVKRNATTEKKALFDTDKAVADYQDEIKQLKYRAEQQSAAEAEAASRQKLMPVETNSNNDGSVSLYPENGAAALPTVGTDSGQKKTLFRRPFSDNSAYQPVKYSLSQTLYFGAQYPNSGRRQAFTVNANASEPIDFQAEKAKLDRKLDEQTSQMTETTTYEEETVVEEKTTEAETGTYTTGEISETMEVNAEDTEDMALAKVQRAENEEKAAASEKTAASLKTQVEQKQKEIERLNQQLETVKSEMDAVENSYIAQVQQIEQAYNQKVTEAKKYVESKRKARKTLDLISYYKEKIGLPVAGVNGLIPPFSLLNILRTATGLTDDTKNYADQLIDDAKKSMLNLGDAVYVGRAGDKIAEIHNGLMDKLQALPVDGLSEFSSAVGAYAKTDAVIKPLTSMFQKVLVEQACADDNCRKVDEEYFVGSYAKDRDFMIPKNAPQEYLPPLREMVHFDDVDYENVSKTADGGITREGFLNSGAKMPEIWKRILNGKAFVDKDVDLKVLLSEGGEAATFMRGGRYPCKLDDQIVDIDNADGQFKIYTSKALPSKATAEQKAYRPAAMSLMPVCNEITLKGTPGLLGKFYVTVEDKVEEVTAQGKVATFQDFAGGAAHSELGTLLKAADNGVFFNDAPAAVFNRLSKMAEEASQDNSSYTKNMQDEVYKKAMLDHNQFGNFLTFAEQEISYRQALEELKLSVDEAKETLFEQFEKIGFTPSADYNLARQADYDLTKDTLNRRKNTLVNEGVEEMGAVNVSDNEIVEERLDKIKNIFTALRKDKEAYISLSDVTDSGAELDERIKTEEANHKVTAEYKKRADEEFEKQLKSYPIPFCAAY